MNERTSLEGKCAGADQQHIKALEAQLQELQAGLEVEKNCKNMAYFFILKKGLLWQFKDFCRGYQGDPFQDCKQHIMSNWAGYISAENKEGFQGSL